jgi:hypothetical protein
MANIGEGFNLVTEQEFRSIVVSAINALNDAIVSIGSEKSTVAAHPVEETPKVETVAAQTETEQK